MTINSITLAADNYNLEAGDKSWFQSGVDGTLATLGGTVNGAINSVGYIANAVTNLLPGEDTTFESKDTFDFLQGFGASDSASFYAEHRQGVDAASLVAGSLIPGTLGVKAFQLAAKSKNILAATGMKLDKLDELRKEAQATAGLAEQVYNPLHGTAMKAVLEGYKVNLFESLAFETAALSTTIASPVYDEMSAWDMTKNTLLFGAVGGAIGGSLSAAKTVFGISKAVTAKAGEQTVAETHNLIVSKISGASEEVMLGHVKKLTGDDPALTAPLHALVKQQDEKTTAAFFGFGNEAKRLSGLKTEEVIETAEDGMVHSYQKVEPHQVIELGTNKVMAEGKLAGNIGDNITKDSKVWFDEKANAAIIRDAKGAEVRRIIVGADKTFSNMSVEEAQVAFVNRSRVEFKAGEDIKSSDIPAMEKFLQTPNAAETVTINGLKIEDSNYARNLLFGEKQQALQAQIESGVPPDVAARVLNIHTELKRNAPLWKVPMEQQEIEALNPRYAAITYDTNAFNAAHETGRFAEAAIAHAEAAVMIDSNSRALQSAGIWEGLGFSGTVQSLIPESSFKQMLNTISKIPGAAGAFSFANGTYDSAMSYAQNIGKIVNRNSTLLKEQTLDKLNPLMINLLKNTAAVDELIQIQSKLRLTSEKYVHLAGREGELVRLDEAKRLLGLKVDDAIIDAEKNPSFIKIDNKEVEEFLRAHNEMNLKNYRTPASKIATGRGTWDTLTHEQHPEMMPVYVPPINMNKYPHFLLVRQAPEVFGASSHTSVIVAKDAEELAKKRKLFEDTVRADEGDVGVSRYEFISKSDSKLYHEALGDYEYARGLNESRVDSTMRRAGVLGELNPLLESQKAGAGKDVLDDFVSFHGRMAARTVRDVVEHQYADVFAQIESMGSTLMNLESSKAQKVTKAYLETTKNPYLDVIKTALDISTFPEYKSWAKANELTEQFGTKAIAAINSGADAFGAMLVKTAGKDSKLVDEHLAEATARAERLGMPAPFSAASKEVFDAQIAQSPIFSKSISRANGLISLYALGLDTIQAVNNTVGLAVMQNAEIGSVMAAIRRKDASVAGRLVDIQFPTDKTAPVPEFLKGNSFTSTVKLTAGAIKRYFQGGEVFVSNLEGTGGEWIKKTGKELLEDYMSKGLALKELQQYRQLVDNLSFTGAEGSAEISGKVDQAIKGLEYLGDKGRSLTGNNFAERFTRFIAADAMRQITDHALAQGVLKHPAEAETFWNTAVNRIQGNMIASQRPVAFQGNIGQAVGLFMTYQVNLMQQLFRHVGNGDKVATGMLLGTQGALYGMQGLPGWGFINSHIVADASGNTSHADLYSTANNLLGHEVANWALYGVGSNALGVINPDLRFNLYTRGDINPRNLTVIPSKIEETVIYNATAGFVNNIINMKDNFQNGAPLNQTFWQALQHNGINRPLAGFGAVMAGGTYSSKGELIAANPGGETLFQLSNALRLAGAKPLEDAIQSDALFRTRAFNAADKERRDELARAVRLESADGTIDPEKIPDFAAAYAKTGGSPQHFRSFMIDKLKSQQQGIVERSSAKLREPIAQNYMSIIGGDEEGFSFNQRE